MRLLLLILACAASGVLTAQPVGNSGIEVREFASPASAISLGAALTRGPDGTVWLSWIEAAGAGNEPAGHAHAATVPAGPANTLRFSTFDEKANAWRQGRTIVRAPSVTRNGLDVPQLAVDGTGTAHVLWTDGHGGALRSASRDRGETWSPPAPWSKAGNEVEKFSLTRLEDGRVLVAWLDGRAHASGGRQQLFARHIDDPDSGDECIDASVCDCCQTALTPFLDGGALVAYRGRSNAEIRDIFTARLRGKRWDKPQRLNADEWKINACPVNGPRIAADAGRVSAAWFTGAGNDPRVLVSFSPDAGTRWLEPLRIDRGHPAGHVDTAILRDSALVVTWLESDGSLWLARLSPEFELTPPVQLTPAGAASVHAIPRLALLRDYAGEKTSAELLVAYTQAGPKPQLRTLSVTIPEGTLLADERSCGCTPGDEQLEAVPIRGRVVAADPARNTVRVSHAEIPGVFAPGTDEFRIDPVLLGDVHTGGEFLGSLLRRDGAWNLIDVRWLPSAR